MGAFSAPTSRHHEVVCCSAYPFLARILLQFDRVCFCLCTRKPPPDVKQGVSLTFTVTSPLYFFFSNLKCDTLFTSLPVNGNSSEFALSTSQIYKTDIFIIYVECNAVKLGCYKHVLHELRRARSQTRTVSKRNIEIENASNGYECSTYQKEAFHVSNGHRFDRCSSERFWSGSRS
jgi:hypothetical protein